MTDSERSYVTDGDVEEVISAVTAPVAKFGPCEVGVRFVLNEMIEREVEKAARDVTRKEANPNG